MTRVTERRFDLEERTFNFARSVRRFVRLLPRNFSSVSDVAQLLRASGSVGANYIEANEALSKKDFVLRIKICRKEAKESGYWLALLESGEDRAIEDDRESLIREARELTSIFGAIMRKSEAR